MRTYASHPRLEVTRQELPALLAELHKLGFGRDQRSPDGPSATSPMIDELTLVLEDLAFEMNFNFAAPAAQQKTQPKTKDHG